MKFAVRLGIIAFWPLLAVAVILCGREEASRLPEAPAYAVMTTLRWLAICTGIYLLNHVIAWRYITSWPLFVSRALAWAVIAYICICNLVDLIGENPGAIPQIVGLAGYAGESSAAGLAVQVSAWAVILAMSAVCIGFGFESTGEAEDRGPSD